MQQKYFKYLDLLQQLIVINWPSVRCEIQSDNALTYN